MTLDAIADISGLDWVRSDTTPEAPEDLTDAAKEVWNYQLSQAANLEGYISAIDLTLFKEYCYLYGEMREVEELIPNRLIIEKGVRRVHPLYSEMQKLRKDFITMGNLFGFSPISRAKLKLSKVRESKDPYADGI